jgi:hypothetical protein
MLNPNSGIVSNGDPAFSAGIELAANGLKHQLNDSGDEGRRASETPFCFGIYFKQFTVHSSWQNN